MQCIFLIILLKWKSISYIRMDVMLGSSTFLVYFAILLTNTIYYLRFLYFTDIFKIAFIKTQWQSIFAQGASNI